MQKVVSDEKYHRKQKTLVFFVIFTVLWWISPLDDLVLPTAFLDEIILTVIAILKWVYFNKLVPETAEIVRSTVDSKIANINNETVRDIASRAGNQAINSVQTQIQKQSSAMNSFKGDDDM